MPSCGTVSWAKHGVNLPQHKKNKFGGFCPAPATKAQPLPPPEQDPNDRNIKKNNLTVFLVVGCQVEIHWAVAAVTVWSGVECECHFSAWVRGTLPQQPSKYIILQSSRNHTKIAYLQARFELQARFAPNESKMNLTVQQVNGQGVFYFFVFPVINQDKHDCMNTLFPFTFSTSCIEWVSVRVCVCAYVCVHAQLW